MTEPIPNRRCAPAGDGRVERYNNHNSDWFLDLMKLWLGPAATIVETGTNRAVSARKWASMVPLGRVVSIDPKNETRIDPDFPNLCYVRGSSAPNKQYQHPVLNMVAECRDAGFEMTEHIDLFYIDAIHSPEFINRELDHWLPHYSPRIVGGHDYNPNFMAYLKRVCDYFGQPPHIVLGDSSWFYFRNYAPAEKL